jgi:hypothetical protein
LLRSANIAGRRSPFAADLWPMVAGVSRTVLTPSRMLGSHGPSRTGIRSDGLVNVVDLVVGRMARSSDLDPARP